ncbi:MAG: Uncharacterised protein [Prochlorococcus marinus str. MIT 9215]|nr:MAG: Uncharacterised protein [Prochlorococcus marinus str. MIT 9215]
MVVVVDMAAAVVVDMAAAAVAVVDIAALQMQNEDPALVVGKIAATAVQLLSQVVTTMDVRVVAGGELLLMPVVSKTVVMQEPKAEFGFTSQQLLVALLP